LELAGKTATGLRVPAAVVETLGSGKRPPVRVTINGYTYRNTVAVYGGEYFVGVSAEHRAGADVSAGDVLDVTLELDTDAREVGVPDDLAAALAAHPMAKACFDGLSYSKRRRIVLDIEAAKSDDTRLRRVTKVIGLLSEGRDR
jgi:hypothetical protein